MLKKLNLLVQEITNEIEKDYRFSKISRYLSRNLTNEEKDKLNKKYNEIVKEELIDAMTSHKQIKIFYVSDNGVSGRWTSIIEKVWQENSKWFCTFLTFNFQMTKKALMKHFKEDIADQKARQECEKTQPISHITTEKILDMMQELQKSLSQYDPKKYYEEFNNVDEDIKYVIENKLTSKDAILKLLSVPIANSLNISKSCDPQDFQNQELLSKFNVDKNNKDFKKALINSKSSGQSWYYNGGTSLILKATLTVNAGKRFDFNRLKIGDFRSQFKTSSGYGTKGEF